MLQTRQTGRMRRQMTEGYITTTATHKLSVLRKEAIDWVIEFQFPGNVHFRQKCRRKDLRDRSNLKQRAIVRRNFHSNDFCSAEEKMLAGILDRPDGDPDTLRRAGVLSHVVANSLFDLVLAGHWTAYQYSIVR